MNTMTGLRSQHDTSNDPARDGRRNPFLFVVGCQRSGTTMLQRMLDQHSMLAIGYDSHFIPRPIKKEPVGVDPPLTDDLVAQVRSFPRFARLGIPEAETDRAAEGASTYGGFISKLYDAFGRMHGKPLAGEKSPGYCRHLPHLDGLFPWARTIHLIRDGRDITLSILDWKKGPAKLELFREEPVATCALWWRRDLIAGRRDGAVLGPEKYLEVNYEALVDDADRELRAICVFLGLEFEPTMTAYHQGRRRDKPGLSAKAAWLPPTSGLRDWRTQMSQRDVEIFETLAGDLLSDLGYERVAERPSSSVLEAAERCRSWWTTHMDHKQGPRTTRGRPQRKADRRTARGYGRNPFVFIVGCPRSGTTLLKRIVDAHPQLAITPETHWIPRYLRRRVGLTDDGLVTPVLVEELLKYHKFPNLRIDPAEVKRLVADEHPTYSAFVSAIFDLYAARHGKPFAGDKTPGYVQDMGLLAEQWPAAKFVHLIRDGRDVALSAVNWDRAPRTIGRFAIHQDDPLSTAALWWERFVRLGREAGARLGPRICYELRYEALVANPGGECAKLCDFLGLPFDASMLNYHEGRTKDDPTLSAKKAWRPIMQGLRNYRTQMDEADQQRFEAIAGDLLDELDYPRHFAKLDETQLGHAAELRDRFTKDPHYKERGMGR